MPRSNEASKPEVALIDADLWTYDIPFAAQAKKDGREIILPFSYCYKRTHQRLNKILERTGCTSYKMYLTGKGNFRHDIAVTATYKGNRQQPKPFHYNNMRLWLIHCHGAKVINGMEADDALSIVQTLKGDKTCIVSRDKDLRITPGWHYGYRVGNQAESPLEYITEFGYLQKKGSKVIGGGLMFFYYQLLVGDSTDNIKGLYKVGPVKAYNALYPAESEKDLYSIVLGMYQEKYAEKATERLLENGRLLWMVNKLDDNKQPVMWELPNG